MPKSMLWILASILLILALALFTFLIWQKFPEFQVGAIASGDLVNLGTAILTLVSLGVTFGSFYVAIAAYQKSVKDSEEQQKNLDASRKQLQAVVDAAAKQQEILTKNLETSKAQLDLLEEQWTREQERQARRPVAEVALVEKTGRESFLKDPAQYS